MTRTLPATQPVSLPPEILDTTDTWALYALVSVPGRLGAPLPPREVVS